MFVDPSGNQNVMVGAGSSGTYYYYEENGVRLIHGSKEIDWDYYDEWYSRDAVGMDKAMRGTNLAQTAIAATAYFRWSEKIGVPPVSSSKYTSSKVLKPNNQMKIKSSIIDCNSFTAGTKVLTDEGEKNIEDIEVGDKVLSKNEETGEVAYKKVTATFNHETDEIYSIHVGGQTIESTFNHPFYVKDKGWTFVKDLKVGDLLVQSDGNTLKIDSIELEHKQVTVYNMTVDEFNTYFVSDLGIWVHDTNCGYKDITVGKSVRNISTNITRADFEKSLLDDGWAKAVRKDGKVTIYSKDGARYTVSDTSNQGQQTAEYWANGATEVTTKIRLGSSE
ncbi:polymorphic toxin-type HINT domain-containing protein [Brevibacillus choshinensis]|uniref:polymorphic toxin-type HINT domain-containing protein n=1 Tax=Brevibacillus choshinensis TaxID=54911 RepID=UPI002E211ADE|nr:polymorphic toxin-type HINT domain-containing protein [Brevibacillus choshinensis]